jgi:predicted nucleic acid-binding protein
LIYLDSSALVKLAITERETEALTAWLAAAPNLVRVSSSISRVEVPRAIWRADPGALPQTYSLVRRIREIWISPAVLARACGTRPAGLSTLDAIHLASAITIKQDLSAFVSYDDRLLTAAREAGLPVESPALRGWLAIRGECP